MVVKKNEEVRDEEPITEIKDIKENVDISNQTREGDENADPVINEPVITEAPVVEPPKIFTIVEQMPEFPGGEGELFKFIQQNISYPAMERDNDIQGRVIVGFVVNEDGSVSDVAVKKGVSNGLDKEAVRVVKLLPKFKPGKQQGKSVKVAYVLPIMFKLQ
jgi:protein TonB